MSLHVARESFNRRGPPVVMGTSLSNRPRGVHGIRQSTKQAFLHRDPPLAPDPALPVAPFGHARNTGLEELIRREAKEIGHPVQIFQHPISLSA